jgi:thymidine phosphorylase
MQVLENDPAAPMDLRQKALRLAGRVIEFDPDVRGGDGFAIARDILDSGRALAKMNQIIDAQGRRPFAWSAPPVAPLSFVVAAPRDGVVTAIDNLAVARIAQLAGAPKVAGAGIDLLHRLGDDVKAGESLYRVHARFEADLDYARRKADADPGFRVGAADELPRDYVLRDNGAEF